MTNQIKAAFPTCDEMGCHEQYTEDELRVHDAEGLRCYIHNARPENFLVINDQNKIIDFIAIDHCLFEGVEGASDRCECVLFDDTFFCFVELKNTMTTIGRTAGGHRKSAATQIIETYLFFLSKGIKFGSYKLEGYVAFIIDPPTAVTATSLSDRFSLNQYEIEYFESAYKKFS